MFARSRPCPLPASLSCAGYSGTAPRWGIRDFVLNLHYLPETITAQVGDGADLGVRVRYSFESPVLGSAGGPRKALDLLPDEPFFIINGDTLTNVDLDALAEHHREPRVRS